MEHSTSNNGDSVPQYKKGLSSFDKKVLLFVIALSTILIGVMIAIAISKADGRVMAPGPIGSPDSVTKPLS